jgi:Tol biopolymer transport system component
MICTCEAMSTFKRFPVTLRPAILLLMASTLQAQSSPASQSSLKGQPHLFGPGVISTRDAEANASLTPDENTVYFSKHNPGWGHITIVLAHRKGGHWTKPEVASFSGLRKDTDPRVSPDGEKLFFASNRPTDGGDTPKKDYDLWYVERTAAGRWGEPKHIGSPVNSDGNESYPSVTRDGTLYFESSRAEHPGIHIYHSHLVNGEYSQPELLPFSNQGNDLNPSVATDEAFIVFCSSSRGGSGGLDLFVSFHRPDRSWSEPRNLGSSINSNSSDSATGLSPDNRTLYFASDRIDGPLTRTRRVDYRQLENELHAIQNGESNIYDVDISDLRSLDAP